MTPVGTHWLSRAKSRAMDLLFPAECFSCGVGLGKSNGTPARDSQLCDECYQQLIAADGSVCRRCAAPVPELPELGQDCPHCRVDHLRFDRAGALGPYEGLLRDLVLRMKDDRQGRLASQLGRLLCLTVARRDAELAAECERADLVVPIPARPWQHLGHGAGPVAGLAKAVGRFFRLPVEPGLLKKGRNVLPQHNLSRPARFTNIRGGIGLRAGYSLEAARVMLVDDILTTGATCSEAARVLKRAGAVHVTALVLARTVID